MIHNEDSILFLRELGGESVDGVITDPPYSSGGLHMADRSKQPTEKYTQTQHYINYLGDNMDARAYRLWSYEWLSECYRIAKDGAPLLVFTDWRQLPNLTDAIQMAGWTWRGIAVWNKKNARPQKNGIRQQCEYIIWATKGKIKLTEEPVYLCGYFQYAAVSTNKRTHQAEKPLPLMRELVQIVPRGGVVLDPFAGSGTTIKAAELEGYQSIGIEKHPAIFHIANNT